MPITAKLDEFGKPAWIALMILGFIVWWPLGSRDPRLYHMERTHGMRISSRIRWQSMEPLAAQDGSVPRAHGGPSSGFSFDAPSSGNRAFDEYRTETMRRLEDEQREFHEFLDRLRMAKDKSEFDQFMAERRDRPNPDAPAAELIRVSCANPPAVFLDMAGRPSRDRVAGGFSLARDEHSPTFAALPVTRR